MADEIQTDEVAKSRKGLMGALLAILLVIVAIVGVMYFVGIGPFASLKPEPAAQTPEAPAKEAEKPAETTVTPTATRAAVPLPPADAQEAMYWEQVASAETIGELVEGTIGSYELSQVAKTGDKADVRVKATYRDGTTESGWLLLKQYEGAWYFAMITADGNPTTTPVSGTPDADVIKAIVEQQAANQEVYTAILNGDYRVIAVDKVTTGSGTATIDITLSGGSAAQAKGKITCISKQVSGTTEWFITAFSKS